ncbi:MAG TPA: NAD-dependent deacylase [bacterium]
MTTAQAIDTAADWIRRAQKVIALTGAGVSTESGIPDFRSAEGLWTRYNPSEYATLGAFLRDPVKVWNMLAELEGLLDAKPNPGHVALAKLERIGALHGIVTQNIDGLHQAARSRVVVEFHGSNRTFTCLTCSAQFPREALRSMPKAPGTQMPQPSDCNQRPANGPAPCVLKPDVVFFDEMIPTQAVAGSDDMIRGADLILVIGTSCEVYPAAGIPEQVRQQGGKVIEINMVPAEELEPDLLLQGKFGEILPALASRLLT